MKILAQTAPTPSAPKTTEPAKAVEAPAKAAEAPAKAAEAPPATATISVPDKPDAPAKAAKGAANVPSEVVFGMGVVLLSLFLWYFGTESARRKRIIGTILSIAV
ncbi:MAG: hypothetical protein KDL87_06410, partial [Verrucomicrobiae bacterium]|nr:hypothetical protein [Verrucomicrobiae bacterium]